MSPEPDGAQTDGVAVVELGSPQPRSRRERVTAGIAALRRDRRLVPVLAGLGAVAVFASLLGEWQVTTLTEPTLPEPTQQPAPVSAGIGELGGWATGYLIGVFALAGCLGLVLFGRPAFRDQARILGLTTAGVLGGLLLATAFWLDGNSASIELAEFYVGPDGPRLDVRYGRGIVLAFAGVGALGLALYLSGRFMPAPAAASTPEESGTAKPDEESDWPWRRPRPAPALDTELAEPIDLTVAPAVPFVHLPEGRDDD